MSQSKKEENNAEILIFPLIAKHTRSKEEKKELIFDVEKEIDKLTIHYMKELIRHCVSHGVDIDSSFEKDFQLVSESFKSTLLRSVGKHHVLQDYVDADITQIK